MPTTPQPHPFLQTPEHIQAIVMEILAELDAACIKHPRYPYFDRVHQAAILAEEAGETVQAALQLHYENGSAHTLRKEAIQTAAAAIRLLIHNPAHQEPQKWVKEQDTQVLSQHSTTIVPGLWECINPFTNEMGYKWRDGEPVDVIRYRPQHNVVVCRIPAEPQQFEMLADTLLNHFLPKEMIK